MSRQKRFWTRGIFHGLFLAPKLKYCLTIDGDGIIDQHKTLKGFTDSRRLLKKINISK